MAGEERLRDGAELYRSAAERSRTAEERDCLLDYATDLTQIADWIAATHAAGHMASGSPDRDDAVELRQFYASENGDCWHLARRLASGQVFVRHQANLPSGGHVSDIELAAFLGGPGQSPERQALTQLISLLVGRGG